MIRDSQVVPFPTHLAPFQQLIHNPFFIGLAVSSQNSHG